MKSFPQQCVTAEAGTSKPCCAFLAVNCTAPSFEELIARAGEGGTPVQKRPGAGRILDSSKLADVFGIDFGGADPKPSHKATANKGKSVAPRKAKSANRTGKRSARGKPRYRDGSSKKRS